MSNRSESLKRPEITKHLNHTDADLYFELADAQWLSGQPENTQLALQQALTINPDHPASRKLKELMASGP